MSSTLPAPDLSPPDVTVTARPPSPVVEVGTFDPERLVDCCAQLTAAAAARPAGDRVRERSDADLVAVVEALAAAQQAIDSLRSVAVTELDARDEPRRRTGLHTASWLAAEFGLPRSDAARQARVARTLHDTLPVVADALAAGRITFAHAALLARLTTPRVRDVVVDLQGRLVDLADGVRFERWARDVRGLIDHADADGGHQPRDEHDALTISEGLHGDVHIDATFTGATAATFRAALTKEAERRWRHHHRLRNADGDHPLPTHAELLAEALIELIRRGTAATNANPSAPVTDVTLVVHASDPLHAATPEGVRLADDTTRTLTCDAAIHALVVDSLGVPLDLGTTVRFATPHQRRAAHIRDGGCVHPGCDAPPAWTHLHHCHHAEHGGPTDLVNLASGCPQHHTLWHQPGWGIQPDPRHPGRFTITTPTGRQLPSQRHGRAVT